MFWPIPLPCELLSDHGLAHWGADQQRRASASQLDAVALSGQVEAVHEPAITDDETCCTQSRVQQTPSLPRMYVETSVTHVATAIVGSSGLPLIAESTSPQAGDRMLLRHSRRSATSVPPLLPKVSTKRTTSSRPPRGQRVLDLETVSHHAVGQPLAENLGHQLLSAAAAMSPSL